MIDNKPIGTNSKCQVCGHDYENTTKARPKQYCSDNCRNLNKYLHAMERTLLKVDFTGFKANHLKGDIFAIANIIQCKSRKD